MEIIFTKSSELISSFNCPIINSDLLYKFIYPHWLELNKTYYRLQNTNLTAFRVLGISFTYYQHSYFTSYLVQTPNNEPQWMFDFITPSSVVLSNKDDMFSYFDDKSINLNKPNWQTLSRLIYSLNSDLYDNGSCYFIRNCWTWNKNKRAPERVKSGFNKVLLTKNSLIIQVELNDKQFLTKEECIANQLNDFVVNDFIEEPYDIALNVLPNKGITRTFHIVEM